MTSAPLASDSDGSSSMPKAASRAYRLAARRSSAPSNSRRSRRTAATARSRVSASVAPPAVTRMESRFRSGCVVYAGHGRPVAAGIRQIIETKGQTVASLAQDHLARSQAWSFPDTTTGRPRGRYMAETQPSMRSCGARASPGAASSSSAARDRRRARPESGPGGRDRCGDGAEAAHAGVMAARARMHLLLGEFHPRRPSASRRMSCCRCCRSITTTR